MSEGDVRSQQLKGNIKYIRGRRFYEKKVLWASRVLYLLQIFTKPDLISVQTEQGNPQIGSLYKLSLVPQQTVSKFSVYSQKIWKIWPPGIVQNSVKNDCLFRHIPIDTKFGSQFRPNRDARLKK